MTRTAQKISAMARLLASENLAVVHKSDATTAQMNLAARTLLLPKWEDMSNDLYDMFTSHEVAHAKYTPPQGWHNALNRPGGRSFHGFLNVVEDVRIERLMKQEYPGLQRTFLAAYRELMAKDFFGLEKKGKHVDQLGFTDRLNIHAKMGSSYPVRFSSEEQVWVDEAFAAETFEEAAALAEKFFKKEGGKFKNKKNRPLFMSGHGHDSFFDQIWDEVSKEISRELIDDEDFREAMRQRAEEIDKEKFSAIESWDDDLTDYLKDRQEFEKDQKEEPEEEEQEDPVVETDEAFRENEKTLVQVHEYGLDERIMIIDDNMDINKFIVPADQVVRLTREFVGTLGHDKSLGVDGLKSFLAGEQKVINQLAIEFEMRKNADQLARAGTSKTGKINMNALHKIGLSDDIFQRLTKVPEGKSHGIVMFLDQSSSMWSQYGACLEQVIIVVEFCRRMSIPFDVYGFSSSRSAWKACGEDAADDDQRDPDQVARHYLYPPVPTPGRAQFSSESCHLKQYIHSGMNPTEYKDALLNLWICRSSHLRGRHERFDGTPLNHAMVFSGMIAKRFRMTTKVDCVNVLFITDGEATDSINVNAFCGDGSGSARVLYNGSLSAKFKTDWRNLPTMTASLANLMELATGATYLGIFIPGSTREARSAARKYSEIDYRIKPMKPVKTSFDKDGFVLSENFGFSAYFVIKPLEQKVGKTLVNLDANKSTNAIVREFSKVAAGRVQNRAFLSAFARHLAHAVN